MIQEKLTILKENDVIDETTYEDMQVALRFLQQEEVIKEEDEADTFITHLAMATSRQRKNEEQVDSVEPMIKKEIEAAPEYEKVVSIWKQLSQKINVDFPKNEDDYFYLHLVTLLQNKNQE